MTRSLWITTKNCSGNYVVVLATEQRKCLITKGNFACSGVLVILGGMGRNDVFFRLIVLRGKCTKKHSQPAIYLFSARTEHYI